MIKNGKKTKNLELNHVIEIKKEKKMKNKNLFYLILSLGISSGTILTNRFVVLIPDWLAIVLILLSVISLIVFIIKSRNKRKGV